MQKRKNSFRKLSSQLVSDYIQPLQGLGLVQFSHGITFGNDEMTPIGSCDQISQYLEKLRTPLYCVDQSGRTLEAGIYTNHLLEANYVECKELFGHLYKIAQRFGFNFGKNSLHSAYC